MEKHHWCCINFLKQCRLEILPPACKISRPPTLTSTRLQKGQFQWTKPLPVVKIVLYLNYCLYHSWLTHYHYDGVLAPPPEYTINTGARHLYLRSSILLLFIRLSSFTTNIHIKRTNTHTQGYNNICLLITITITITITDNLYSQYIYA